MAGLIGIVRVCLVILLAFSLSAVAVSGHEELVESQSSGQISAGKQDKSNLGYQHVWPEMRFGWKIVVGSIIAFVGAAFGSVAGIGGGGFFLPMLTLIIGFDQKSSTAISTCMVTGTAASTFFYNLRQRHPTLDLPIIDYDLALLFQPMLVLGMSIGVSLNVVLSEWMITTLLIIVLLGTTAKSFLKGVETWKKESITKKNVRDTSRCVQSNGPRSEDVEERNMPAVPSNGTTEAKEAKGTRVSVIDNVCWKQLGVIVVFWVAILALQIAMKYMTKCSVAYWLLDVSQIPVAVAASSYEAVKLYKGKRVIASNGEAGANWRVHKLVLCCATCGVVGGIVGGLLGLGGGFIMGPLFLEIGVPPQSNLLRAFMQVSSATSTFIMVFSSSMSAVEFYLLKRFPVSYALYYTAVATLSPIIGQILAAKVINALGRASVIIFVLAFITVVSTVSLGGVGIANMVKQIKHKEYMGFESLCSQES